MSDYRSASGPRAWGTGSLSERNNLQSTKPPHEAWNNFSAAHLAEVSS